MTTADIRDGDRLPALEPAVLPQCDCPRASHRHGTRDMYNRHQCPCTPCVEANRKYAKARQDDQRRANPGDLPVCGCTEAWEPHEHGTRGMYNYHRCRCVPCGDANREYNRQANKHRPRREMVDADLVRARIAKLRGAGLTVIEIADMCSVHHKVIDFAVKGRNGKKPKTVKASTFRALNAISYKDIQEIEKPRGRKVDGDASRRQVQSLHTFGWCGRVIASRAGVNASTISSLLAGNGITEECRAGIDRAYAELHGTEAPEETPAQRARATVARTRGIANAWTQDAASDYEYARYSRAH